MDSRLRTVVTDIATRYQASTKAILRCPNGCADCEMQKLATEVAEATRVTVMLALNEFAVYVAGLLLSEQFDETPTNVNADPVAIAGDAGYRKGHNASARHAAALLTGKVRS